MGEAIADGCEQLAAAQPVMGTLIGIARLSRNWLLSPISAVYVEVVRGLPSLFELLLIYTVLQELPGLRHAFGPVPGVFLSNRGLFCPSLNWSAQLLASLQHYP